MKPIHINFAKPGVRQFLHRTPFAHWLFCLASIALCLSALFVISSMYQRRHERDARIHHDDALRTALPLPQKKRPIPQAQANAVNTAILHLNLAWQDIEEAIDAATPESVALLSLEPAPATRTLHIVAEAKTSNDMFDYVEELKQQPFFIGAVLSSHDTNTQDANKPLRFELEAQWQAQGTAP
jgi:Tfp pilus assembly protein PilN